jgi:hypothetical protein
MIGTQGEDENSVPKFRGNPQGARPALIHRRGCEDYIDIGRREIRCKGGNWIIPFRTGYNRREQNSEPPSCMKAGTFFFIWWGGT